MALTLCGKLYLNKQLTSIGVRGLYYSKTRVKGKDVQEQWRKDFLREELERDQKVEMDSLSESDLEIYRLHKEAVSGFKFTYDDPVTGYKVLTTYRHFLKMKCCGNACRHCIYNHEAVEKEKREHRMFNSAFWEDKPMTGQTEERDTPNFEMFINTKPKNDLSGVTSFISTISK